MSGVTARDIYGPRMRGLNTILPFGDSNTNLFLYQVAGYTFWIDRGWVSWALGFSGQRLRLLRNAGVDGNTTAMMKARQHQDVIRYRPGRMPIMGGTNDLLNDIAWTTTRDNLREMYHRARGEGIKVDILGILPASAIASSSTRRLAHDRITYWQREYAYKYDNTTFTDTATCAVDPASATGAPASGITVDGTHASSLLGQRMGRAYINTIGPELSGLVVPQWSGAQASASAPYGNAVLNPTLAGTAGGHIGTNASGQMADSWTQLIGGSVDSAVAAKVARTDRPNAGLQWQQTTVDFAGTATVYFFQVINLAALNYSAGDVLYMQADQELASPVGIDALRLSAVVRDSGGASIFEASGLTPGTGSLEACSITNRTPDFTLPAGSVDILLSAQLAGASAASSGVMRFSNPEIRRYIDVG